MTFRLFTAPDVFDVRDAFDRFRLVRRALQRSGNLDDFLAVVEPHVEDRRRLHLHALLVGKPAPRARMREVVKAAGWGHIGESRTVGQTAADSLRVDAYMAKGLPDARRMDPGAQRMRPVTWSTKGAWA